MDRWRRTHTLTYWAGYRTIPLKRYDTQARWMESWGVGKHAGTKQRGGPTAAEVAADIAKARALEKMILEKGW